VHHFFIPILLITNKKTTMKKIYLLAAITLLGFYLQAQIVYTNLKDASFTCVQKCNNNCYEYNCSKTCPLDLNNDGTIDFNINTGCVVSKYDGGNGTYCCINGFSNWVSIGPAGDDGIPLGSAAAVMPGSEISSLSAGSGGVLRSVSRNCQLDILGGCTPISPGDWPNSTDRYLGLKIILNGQTHYGWARLSVIVDEGKASFKIKDCAYESTPGGPINAGDTGSGLASNHTINKEHEEGIALSKLDITPNPVYSTTTISFTLLQPEKVCLNLYDMSGRLINKLSERRFNGGTHQLILNTTKLNNGIYLLRLQSQSGVKSKKIIVVK